MTTIKINDWDAQLFGFPIATLNTDKFNANTLSEIQNDIRDKNIRMLQYLCACDDIESIHHAENVGFHFIDIRYTFQKILSAQTIFPEKKIDIEFGLATETHIPELLKISAGLYKDTRYYADQYFPRDKVSTVYDTWISNAVHGKFDHLCYCLFIHNQPIAFCTVRFLDEKTCSWGLLGVAEEHQRKSLGSYLLQSVIADLWQRGFQEIRVVTQGKNIAAQRTYQGLGFKTLSLELWYHKWFL